MTDITILVHMIGDPHMSYMTYMICVLHDRLDKHIIYDKHYRHETHDAHALHERFDAHTDMIHDRFDKTDNMYDT